RQRAARPRVQRAYDLPLQGVGVRLRRIQPGHAGRHHEASPAVRRPRPAAGAPHGHGSRAAAAQRVGEFAKVPPGPLSQLWWIWDPEIRELPYDSGQAARLLTRTGWSDSDGDGIRDKAGRPLAFRLLLPTTSAIRKQRSE